MDPDLGPAKDLSALFRQHGVLINASGPQVMRAVTHLDVSAAQVERAAEVIRKAAPKLAAAR